MNVLRQKYKRIIRAGEPYEFGSGTCLEQGRCGKANTATHAERDADAGPFMQRGAHINDEVRPPAGLEDAFGLVRLNCSRFG
jgi:hypothetical protein